MTTLLTFHQNPPLSLYVHIPWCIKKCPYCDFNSHEVSTSGNEEKVYIEALIRDLETELPRIWGRTISSIFIGGGTPSLFSEDSINLLMSSLRARLNIHPEIEITMEANPGTAEAEKFNAYRETGINRLSLGIQSFNDRYLKSLGRIHNSNDALNAIKLAKSAGFENINLDLMFALPGQSFDDAMQDIDMAISQSPAHLSWYQLTIEPNTVFYSKPPKIPDDDESWLIQKQGQKVLEENDFRKYEISAFAKNNNISSHNTNYWQFGDYLGIGAGAHGKITDAAKGKIERFSRHKIPKRYIELAGSDAVITETRVLNRNDLALEFMMNAMRLREGIAANLFFERTGLTLKSIEKQLLQARDKGFLDWQLDSLKPTKTGQRFLNAFLEIFVN